MSDREQWLRVDRIFAAALDLPPDERAGFVEERCAENLALRDELLALLQAAEDETFLEGGEARRSVDAILEEAVEGGPARERADPLIGTELGAFRIVRALGRGGMGSVYLAERSGGFEQHVAIKTLRRGIDTDDVVQRFLAERQILAQLDHPNIARLFDGGSTPDGRPYFVMELVKGEPITAYADHHRLSVAERLDLLKTVGATLQHAHRHLVIHRDLKPSNVYVTHDGVVKLLDFGIARLIGSGHRWGQTRTSTGFRMLTPAFAAPEQVSREPVTTATDVYQLGALAYELLTGVRPFPTDLPDPELERQIVEVEPEPLSRAVYRAGAEASLRRGLATPNELAARLRGDLDVVVGKALAKEPARRYASVERFVEDVDRHLEGRPVRARPATLRYRSGRFVRRNRWFLPAAAAAILALGAYAEASARHGRQLEAERDIAKAEAERAEAVTTFVTDLFGSPNPWEGGERADITVLEALEAGARRVEIEFADRPDLQARLFEVISESYFWLNRLDQAEPLLKRAAVLRAQLDGPDAPGTIEARRKLAETQFYTAGADSATAILEPLLKLVDGSEPDPYQYLHAQILGDLAWVRWGVSDFDSALALYDSADAAFEALVPPDPARHGAVLRQHARAVGQADRPEDEQVAMAARAVALLEAGLPPGHIEIAAARQDLGSALTNAGRQADALVEFDKALVTFTRTLEPTDPNLLAVRSNRAFAVWGLGRLPEAEADYREVLEMGLDRSNPKQQADNLQNLAAVLKAQDRNDEAIEMALQAHDVYERELGMHYLTAFPLLTIAEIELARQNASAGARISAEAYDILVQTLPEKHFAPWVALCRWGRGQWGMGRREEGLDRIERASEVLLASSLGPEHRYVVECTTARDGARAGVDGVP